MIGLDAQLRNDRVAADVADRVGDVKIVELGDGDDVAGDRFLDFFLLLALHDVNVAGLGGLAAAEVDDCRVVGEPAAQDPQIAELAHELVVDGLEHLRDQGALLGWKDFFLGGVRGLAAGAEAVDVRRGEPAGRDQVEQLLETQVFAGANAQNGYELALSDRVVRRLSQLVGSRPFRLRGSAS